LVTSLKWEKVQNFGPLGLLISINGTKTSRNPDKFRAKDLFQQVDVGMKDLQPEGWITVCFLDCLYRSKPSSWRTLFDSHPGTNFWQAIDSRE